MFDPTDYVKVSPPTTHPGRHGQTYTVTDVRAGGCPDHGGRLVAYVVSHEKYAGASTACVVCLSAKASHGDLDALALVAAAKTYLRGE